MGMAIFELADNLIAIGMSQNAVTIGFIELEVTLKDGIIGIIKGTLSMSQTG